MCSTNKYCGRIPCCSERVSEKHPQTSLQCLWKCCGQQKHGWFHGKKSDGFYNRKITAPWFVDLPCSGCPVTAVSPEMLQCGDAIVCKDWCITTKQQALILSISKGSVSHIIRDLGYSKVCTGWVPGSLAIEHKTERKPFLWSCRHVLKVREIASYPGLLQQMKPGSLILNRQLKDNPWNSIIFNLPGRGWIQNVSISRTVMATVSQDCERDNSDAYIRTLTELTKLFKQVQLHMIVTDSGRHQRLWWDTVTPSTLQPHPVCLDFNWFGALKKAILGTKCENLDDVVRTVKTWLYEQNEAWNWQVIHTFIPHWRKAVEVDGGFV